MIIFIEGPDEEGKQIIYDAAKKEFADEAYFYECVNSAINDNDGSDDERMADALGRINMAIDLANGQMQMLQTHLFILNGPMHVAAVFDKPDGRAAKLAKQLICSEKFDHAYIAVVMRSPKSDNIQKGYDIMSARYREITKNCLSSITSVSKSNRYKFVISGNGVVDHVADFISGIRNIT